MDTKSGPSVFAGRGGIGGRLGHAAPRGAISAPAPAPPTKPEPRPSMLGRKQRIENDAFLAVARDIETYVSRARMEHLISYAAWEIQAVTKNKRAGYAWSGGKDSLALQVVCERAGIVPCVLAVSDLEYPAFRQYITDAMPEGLTVINTGQNVEWLAAHPEMLFPATAALAGKWFKIVQHAAQEQFYKARNLDMLLLGRRRADGNFVGKDGAAIYESRGVVRYSPIADWTHEEVLACVQYYDCPMPPCYTWPNGFIVGTGAWAARQYTGSVENGWREVSAIDGSVVEAASTRLPSARDYLAGVRSGRIDPRLPSALFPPPAPRATPG